MENTNKEFAPVYFSSTTKKLIGPKYGLQKNFQEIFDWKNCWFGEESSWIIESTDAEYVNISVYSPLSGGSYLRN